MFFDSRSINPVTANVNWTF